MENDSKANHHQKDDDRDACGKWERFGACEVNRKVFFSRSLPDGGLEVFVCKAFAGALALGIITSRAWAGVHDGSIPVN